MVQYLSINFFCWISSIFVGFFKSLCFLVSSCVIVVIVIFVVIVIEMDSGDNYLLACDAMCFGNFLHVCWRNLMPRSWDYTLNMEGAGSSEVLVTGYQTRWYHLPEDSNCHLPFLHHHQSHFIQNLLSVKWSSSCDWAVWCCEPSSIYNVPLLWKRSVLKRY